MLDSQINFHICLFGKEHYTLYAHINFLHINFWHNCYRILMKFAANVVQL